MLDKKLLNEQSDRIEAVLAAHHIAARVIGGDVTPRQVRFEVNTALGAQTGSVQALKEELAKALGVPSVRVARQGVAIVVEIPRSDPQQILLSTLLSRLSPLPALTAVLGLTADGRPLLLRLPSPEVNPVLVVVAAGTRELLRTIEVSLERQPPDHQQHIAVGRQSVASTLKWVNGELTRREHSDELSPTVIMLKELAEVNQDQFKVLTRLVADGRQAGIYLVAGTRHPDLVAKLPNFPVRLVGRMASAVDAQVASGLKASGAEKLLGHGDFIAVAAGGATRFQAAIA